MISKIIRNFIAKQMAGRSDDGIMITLRDPQKVELAENIMADLLMRNGIDPRAITSEAQLKGILNQIEAVSKQTTQSGIRNTESAKVFDLKGRRIKDTDNIMGGEEMPPPGSRGGKDDIAAPVQSSEESLKNMIEAENKKNIAKIKQRQKMLDDAIEDASPGFANDIKYDAEIVAENLAERMGLVYDDLPTKQRLDLYDQAYTGLSKQRFKNKPKPEDKAYGGRIGLKDGPDLSKRNFMKILGGLAAIPVFGKFFKQADKVAPAAEKVAEVAGQAPSYFFDLVAKIKLLGEPRRTPSYKERVNEYQYTGKDGIEYELIEDLDTGEIMIQKDKIGVGGSGDKSFDVIEDRTELRYKKPKPDEGDPNPTEEYEEFKVEFDSDGTAADATEIDEISKMEIMKEITDEAPPIKKAGGGLAYMLGE